MTDHTPQLIQPQLPFDEIPYGYCACGCGQKTKIAPRSSRRNGYVRGEPFRFLHGHRESAPLAVLFWRHVTPGSLDECWLWTAAIHKAGYGVIGKSGGGYQLAHRASWEIHFGPIPDGLQVLHRCDVNYPRGDFTNRRCVNPSHLWLGTNEENNADMMAKGRNSPPPCVSGESNAMAKLTSEQVREIRALAAQGVRQKEIAKRFGIGKNAISQIVLRQTWKHI